MLDMLIRHYRNSRTSWQKAKLIVLAQRYLTKEKFEAFINTLHIVV